jgi:hypothetical protein
MPPVFNQIGAGTLTKNAIKELQGIKLVLVAGAAANTNIPITGIKAADVIVSVIQEPGTVAAAPIDRTSVTSVTSAGNIQCTQITNTNGAMLRIMYFSKPTT